MRIGSLTGLAFQKYDRSTPRSLVNKVVPGYVESMNYDIVATSPTIQVDGTIVATSAANLASQISLLKAMYRTRRTVWIDASDQVQGLCDFVRISKLTGPTIDSSKGPLVASFSLEAIPLLPWGTTLLNPYSTSGVVLRDLSGVGFENVLNPLSMNCNYILSSTLQTNQGGTAGQNWVSWELIVDNQNAFSGSQTLINECTATTGFSAGAGETGSSFSNDTVNFRPLTNTASVKESATSTSSGAMQPSYAFTNTSFSNFDFLVLWVRGDFGGNSTGNVTVYLGPNGFASWFYWTRNNLNAYTWYRLVLPLRSYTGKSGSPSLGTIGDVAVLFNGAHSASSNAWLDEIYVDVAAAVNLEFQIPDQISPTQYSGSNNIGLQLLTWTGSAYSLAEFEGPQGENAGSSASITFLDGTTGTQIASVRGYYAIFTPGAIGTTQKTAHGDYESQITYTTAYGTNNRFGIMILMAPATSDSVGGGYPSDDLSGIQAINKARVKLLAYFSQEDTSYTGL